jgi:hypothetical protein
LYALPPFDAYEVPAACWAAAMAAGLLATVELAPRECCVAT